MNRVVITGMGWITPMGHSIEAVWKRLIAGESGIAPTSLFDASTFPTRIGAEVKEFNLAEHIPDVTGHEQAGRNKAARHRKGNGPHGSEANGAGSAVDGTPRTARVEAIRFGDRS